MDAPVPNGMETSGGARTTGSVAAHARAVESYEGRQRPLVSARSGGKLGTVGLNAPTHGGDRTSLSQPAIAPRISTGAIASAAGTLPRLVEGLLDACRSGTMEVRERAAAALHSLAEQAKDNADLIAKAEDGLLLLILLLETGSPDAQAHAAAALSGVTKVSKDHQVRRNKAINKARARDWLLTAAARCVPRDRVDGRASSLPRARSHCSQRARRD